MLYFTHLKLIHYIHQAFPCHSYSCRSNQRPLPQPQSRPEQSPSSRQLTSGVPLASSSARFIVICQISRTAPRENSGNLFRAGSEVGPGRLDFIIAPR